VILQLLAALMGDLTKEVTPLNRQLTEGKLELCVGVSSLISGKLGAIKQEFVVTMYKIV